jgi:hypothetical protein
MINARRRTAKWARGETGAKPSVSISSTATLEAIAYRSGWAESSVASATFVIGGIVTVDSTGDVDWYASLKAAEPTERTSDSAGSVGAACSVGMSGATVITTYRRSRAMASTCSCSGNGAALAS